MGVFTGRDVKYISSRLYDESIIVFTPLQQEKECLAMRRTFELINKNDKTITVSL
jgi:hypothetical protein